jgi:hypothetical protein
MNEEARQPSRTAATYVSGTPTLGLYQPRALRAAATRVVPSAHISHARMEEHMTHLREVVETHRSLRIATVLRFGKKKW